MENAFLLDVDYVHKPGKSIIRLLLKKGDATFRLYDQSFEPYFYVLPNGGFEEAKKKIEGFSFAGKMGVVKTKRVEEADKKIGFKPKKLLKVIAFSPGDVPQLREQCKSIGQCFEFDIPYYKRYIFDSDIYPFSWVGFDYSGKIASNVSFYEGGIAPALNTLALDIETHNPSGLPDATKDPCIMIGYSDGKDEGIYSYSKKFSLPFVKTFQTEKQMIEGFSQLLKEKKVDLLCTYNGDQFDLPYLQTRSDRLGANMHLGRDRSKVKTKQLGLRKSSKLGGRVHYDVYPVVSFLNFIGTIKVQRLTLENVYQEVLGGKKLDVKKLEIWKTWDKGSLDDLNHLADYCRVDAKACFELTNQFLHLQTALCKLTGLTLFDSARATASQLVEALLIRRAFERKELVPNKPEDSEISARMNKPIEGAFVKVPEPGVYENIAVLDFKSLYPSIITSYNLDASTFNCDCCADPFVSPQGYNFCKKNKGIVPTVLNEVLDNRFKIKDEMKKLDKNSEEYKKLDGEQWGLKILANSFYGYLLYARSRWYTREGGEATTALARKYIQDTMAEAEKNNLKVLYGDSLTSERFVTIMDAEGFVRIKNVEDLFNDFKDSVFSRGDKEIVLPKGVKALSIDPTSLEPVWRDVNEVIRHKTDKAIFRVNQKYGETRVTTDHSLMTLKEGKLVEAKPEEMASSKMFKVCRLPEVKQIQQIDVFDVLRNYSREITYKGVKKKLAVEANDNAVWFGWMAGRERISVKRFIKVGSNEFESLCRLFGAYVAEGSSSTSETTSSKYGASIASSDVPWLEQLREDYLLLFNGVKASIIPSMTKTRELTYPSGFAFKTIEYVDNTHKLQMMNSLAAVFFNAFCGQKSSGKKLPDFIFHVAPQFQKILLDNAIKGDGSHSVNKHLGYSKEYIEKNFSYTTKSLHLISGLSLLLNQLGRNYSIQYRPSKKVYTLKTSDKFNERVKTNLVKENYDGFVYDLSVEGTHTFVDSCGQVLLHNTDSTFLQYEQGKENLVKEFQKKINATLPGRMELELEDFYPRGIFVGKKTQGKAESAGAKKKYALINKDGKIKIRGFELVRRDWSKVARDTQRKVLEIVLKEGDVAKAAELVRNVVNDLKDGKVPLEDCVIWTQLRKKTKDYEIMSPEIAAVLNGRKQGLKIPEGAVVGFVITNDGKTISEKSRVIELAKQYDSDYYINNQVVPAVLKILGALGYDKDSIKMKGMQQGLGSW